ncbi:MAG: OmpA family protein [bacterium]
MRFIRRTRQISYLLQDQQGGAPAYMTSMTCLIMILLTFFIGLLSNATFEDVVKKEIITKSVKGGFGILDGGFKLEDGSEVLFPSPDLMGKPEDFRQNLNAYKETIKKKAEERRLMELLSEFEAFIQEKGGGGEGLLNIQQDQQNLIITIGSAAIFSLGQVSVSDTGKEILGNLAEMIKSATYPVLVEGHTDNWPISSKAFPSNWELSMIRAVNVVKFFIDDTGISSERLGAAGYGEYLPLVPNNNNPKNMAKNRRIKIVFVGASEF